MPVKQRKPRTYFERFRQQYPLLWNIVLIVVIILVMALAAHLLMQLGTRHGTRCRVPDFSGIRLHEAERIAHENDLKIIVNDSLFVPVYEGGIVLDQLPGGGVEVKPGRTIYLTINAFREKMVPVPYVAGRSLRQAKNMLEIAGLEIAELIYRPDIATNYVLEEYCGKERVTEDSNLEAAMGSGVTLHVGVEYGNNTTVVPSLVGFSLREAKSRLWELGLNIGRVDFDAGINLLNQRDAGVYIQTPVSDRTVVLGSRVDLRLTLDRKKIDEKIAEVERAAEVAAAERLRMALERADSLEMSSMRETTNAFAETDASESDYRYHRDNEGFFD